MTNPTNTGAEQGRTPPEPTIAKQRIDIYRSGWNPPGYRRDWDRCSMSVDSTAGLLGEWHNRMQAQIVEAVGWFRDDGSLAYLAADYAHGRRLHVRVSKRGVYTISQERIDSADSRHG